METIEGVTATAITASESIDEQGRTAPPPTGEQLIAEEMVAGLAHLANFIGANLKIAMELRWSIQNLYVGVKDLARTVGADDKTALQAAIRAGLKHGAKVTKSASGDTHVTKLAFSKYVSVGLYAQREEVCRAVVVGTEEVEIVDPNWTAPTPPKITVTRDKVDWVCEPVLKNGKPGEIED